MRIYGRCGSSGLQSFAIAWFLRPGTVQGGVCQWVSQVEVLLAALAAEQKLCPRARIARKIEAQSCVFIEHGCEIKNRLRRLRSDSECPRLLQMVLPLPDVNSYSVRRHIADMRSHSRVHMRRKRALIICDKQKQQAILVLDNASRGSRQGSEARPTSFTDHLAGL